MNKIILPIMSLMLFLSGCTTVAEVAGYNTATLNAQAEKSYLDIKNNAQQQKAIDTTSNTARRIHAIFQRMKPFADQANQTNIAFNWEMTVIRSDELNAWAMPGGKMAFYTGLVEKLNLSDDEIAAVIGHEMTHALEEHAKKGIGQQILTSIAIQYGGQALQSQTGINTKTIDIGSNILSEYGIGKPFSRSQESEADAGGLRLMAQAGYNPEAAISLWNKMNQVNDNNNLINALTSTHPTNNARMEAMRRLLPEVMPIYQAAPKPNRPAQSKSNSKHHTKR